MSTANSTPLQQIPPKWQATHDSESKFDNNDIVLYIIWSFVGFVLGVQVVAMISVVIWGTLDCCRTLFLQIKKLAYQLYFRKTDSNSNIDRVHYGPMELNDSIPLDQNKISHKGELSQEIAEDKSFTV